MAKIEWKRGRYSVDVGYVGDVELFQASQSTTRGDSSWDLRIDLPGMKRHHKAASESAVKDHAEQILEKFLDRLGLIWKEPS